MTSLATSLTIALLALSSSAAPTRRDDSQNVTQSVTNYMQEALTTFLASQSVTSFSALGSGWQAIDFAGNNAQTGDLANQALFTATDQQQNVSNPKGPLMQFSTAYIAYVGKLTSALGNSTLTTEQQQNIKQTTAAWTQACESELPAALNTVLANYISDTGSQPKSKTDPAFTQYAATDPNYQQASDQCQSAYTASQKALVDAYGVNNAVFQSTINNIAAINTPALTPGVTMEVSSAVRAGSTNFGKYIPYYSIPVLNGTVQSWQSGNALSSWNFDSSTESGSTSNTTTTGGGGLSFIWEDLSGSGSGGTTSIKTTSSVQAQSFSVSFGAINLMEIDRGIWFDSWASASALQSPADDIAQKGVPAFEQFFGSADQPGPLTSYKDQALVVYEPSFTVTFSSASQAADFYQSQGGASACFLFICAGGSGSKTTNNTHYEEGSTAVSYNDTSGNPYIVGYTYKQFWTSGQTV